jgi:hypothetical protein
MKPWQYMNRDYTEANAAYQGFVYEIVNTTNNKVYIGQKNFWRTIKLPPLKGKTRRRYKRTESDWQQYFGSSTTLQQDVDALGPDHFHRRILYMCANRNQMNYWESKTQFERDVLLNSNYYNEIINCRVTARGLST